MPDDEEPGPWTVPGGRVLDYPRFEYRSAMLDVARHFFSVEQVKRYIDLISLYKINHLHLHPTDDQSWRIEIDSWPKLTEIGGSTEVDGGLGGILHGRRLPGDHRLRTGTHITVVPEIDVPGHTNAATASYGELRCNGEPTDFYTGASVGFSAVCTTKEFTYELLDDVIRELAEMTPGPIHPHRGRRSRRDEPGGVQPVH